MAKPALGCFLCNCTDATDQSSSVLANFPIQKPAHERSVRELPNRHSCLLGNAGFFIRELAF